MFPAPFDYRSPRSVEEALELLTRGGDDARVLAGGQSLIPAMRFRLARPSLLVDINPIEELAYLRELRYGKRAPAADDGAQQFIFDAPRPERDMP